MSLFLVPDYTLLFILAGANDIDKKQFSKICPEWSTFMNNVSDIFFVVAIQGYEVKSQMRPHFSTLSKRHTYSFSLGKNIKYI